MLTFQHLQIHYEYGKVLLAIYTEQLYLLTFSIVVKVRYCSILVKVKLLAELSAHYLFKNIQLFSFQRAFIEHCYRTFQRSAQE